jgi:toxin ParE1/3/4
VKKYTVIFSPLALIDIEQAVYYYNEQQAGLGKRFAGHLQTTLNAIKRNPFFATVRYDDVRCTQVKKFPFLIHYTIDEDTRIVTIAAVYSTYQEPYW